MHLTYTKDITSVTYSLEKTVETLVEEASQTLKMWKIISLKLSALKPDIKHFLDLIHVLNSDLLIYFVGILVWLLGK